MKIPDIQQILFPCFNPSFLSEGLAFWAMPVAAGIVGDTGVATLIAGFRMSTQSTGTAVFNSNHGFLNVLGQLMVLKEGLSMLLKDIL
jgi:hypothetical protein